MFKPGFSLAEVDLQGIFPGETGVAIAIMPADCPHHPFQ